MFRIEKLSLDNILLAGTKWEILEPDGDYSSSEYKLLYIFRNSSFIKEYYTTASSGHLLEIPASETALFPGGYYSVVLKAVSLTDTTIIHPVGQCVVYIRGDILTSSDSRSFYLRMVEKLETALLSLADKTMSSVSIDGVNYNYNDMERIQKLLNYYRYKAGIKEGREARNILITFRGE